MFLVYYSPPQNIIEYILQIIEDNSVLVGVLTSMITGSLWLRKFLREKRAEAFFGFYAKLSLRLKVLQSTLNENGQLNILDSDAGNIYSLIYFDSCYPEVCKSYKEPGPKERDLYKNAAKELKQILLETEHNVYPLGSNKKKWYESQYVLFSFCEFLEKIDTVIKTNKTKTENGELKHIVKCKALVEAINYIQKSIEKAKY